LRTATFRPVGTDTIWSGTTVILLAVLAGFACAIVVVAAGVVAAGTSVAAATTQPGTPASAELGVSAVSASLTKAQFIVQANAL
jgi:hypothetical protein